MARDNTKAPATFIGDKDGFILRGMPDNKMEFGPNSGYGDNYIYIGHQMYRVEKPKKNESLEKEVQPRAVYDHDGNWLRMDHELSGRRITYDKEGNEIHREPNLKREKRYDPREAFDVSLLKQFDDAMREGAVTQERGEDYGHPAIDFVRATTIKEAVKDCPEPLLRHVLEMIGVKMARAVNNPYKLDTWVDIAGYSRCAVMILERLRDD